MWEQAGNSLEIQLLREVSGLGGGVLEGTERSELNGDAVP